jgi:xanthine dehydrogenase YagR molybdenum-binding subunit
MNTRTARSQYMSAMIWGISSALHEATEIDPRVARYSGDNRKAHMKMRGAQTHTLKPALALPRKVYG